MARRARGFSLAVVLVVLALVMVALVAGLALSRLGRSSDDAGTTSSRLERAAGAIEAFASAAHRLPCPANGAVDTGLEVLDANPKKCLYPEGTVPWSTIGLRRDDAFDGWGNKISYRVYTGDNAGKNSLVQPEGVNMTQCDTVEPTAGVTDATTGLCVTNADPRLRSTSSAVFLANNRLQLTEQGTPVHNDVAYVLLSHGVTALGAWTASNTRRDLPTGDERNNTNGTGPFMKRAFSEPDTPAQLATHFDDLLVYRTLPELVKRIGLEARDWFDTPPPGSALFNPVSVSTATGVAVGNTGSTALGRNSLTIGSVTATGYVGSLVGTDLTYDNQGGGGLGVASGSSLMSANEGEWLHLELGQTSRKLGLTLADMGYFTQAGDTFVELVGLQFVKNGVQVDVQVVGGCHPDGDLSHYEVTAAADFDTVDVFPIQSFGLVTGARLDTQVLVSEIVGCAASASTCRTSQYTAARAC